MAVSESSCLPNPSGWRYSIATTARSSAWLSSQSPIFEQLNQEDANPSHQSLIEAGLATAHPHLHPLPSQ